MNEQPTAPDDPGALAEPRGWRRRLSRWRAASAAEAGTESGAGMSLARRYLLLSLVVVILGGGAAAYALGQLIESSAINRTTSVTAVYVDGFIAPELQSLATAPDLTPDEVAALDRLRDDASLNSTIVSFRIWSLDGRVLYSPFSALVGQHFDMTGERGQAAKGAVGGDISTLSDPENVYERERWSRLIEIYLPVREVGSSRIIAVAEFYQLPDEVDAEVTRDRLFAWALVGGATILAYLALVRVVRQGSATIQRQQGELHGRVRELSELLTQNARLSERIRHAAARTTAITEMERRRIGSDLHDGPSQTLAFAMLRLDAVESRVGAADAAADADLQAVQSAVGDALRDMRTIAAGLRTPELEQAGPADVLRRAMADHERRSGEAVTAELDGLPAAAPLATKIALFRIVSEALSSAARHGSGAPVTIASHATADGFLETVVTDTGPGFNVTAGAAAGHLGLAGMRERAEMLGGGFEVSSTLGTGTTVRVRLPLIEPTDEER